MQKTADDILKYIDVIFWSRRRRYPCFVIGVETTVRIRTKLTSNLALKPQLKSIAA
jgi:hypothetical protein